MKSRVEEADARHRRGYNCAQAVACTYCDDFGMDEKTMFRIAEGLGRGSGSMNGTCGAIAAVCLLAGLKNSDGNLEHPASKQTTYAVSAQALEMFQKKSGAVICRQLKGIDSGRVLCSCQNCVRNAAEIAEALLYTEKEDQ